MIINLLAYWESFTIFVCFYILTVFTDSVRLQNLKYDQGEGFIIYFDFISLISSRFKSVIVSYSFYEGSSAKTPVKMMKPVNVESLTGTGEVCQLN